MSKTAQFWAAVFSVPAILFFASPTYAECILLDSSETRPAGTIVYNQKWDTPQLCKKDGRWVTLAPFDADRDPCTMTNDVGTMCRDNESKYAGTTVSGTRVYVPLTDQDGGSGAIWGTFGYVTGATSPSDGKANSDLAYAAVIAGEGTHNPGDGQTNNAFVLCKNLRAGGYEDWYVPAQEELAVVQSHHTTIGSLPGPLYWSSTEYNNNQAMRTNISNGLWYNNDKSTATRLRCVRRNS